MPIDSDDDAWDAAFHDVLLATTRSVQAALPHLRKTKGAIVTTAAYSARSPHRTPAALRQPEGGRRDLHRGVRPRHGGVGVRANTIAPGAVETDALHAVRGYVAETGLPVRQGTGTRSA